MRRGSGVKSMNRSPVRSIGTDLVIVERNYLLLDEAPSDAIAPRLDVTYYLDTPERIRVARSPSLATARHMDSSVQRISINRVDRPNSTIVESTRRRAHFIVHHFRSRRRSAPLKEVSRSRRVHESHFCAQFVHRTRRYWLTREATMWTERHKPADQNPPRGPRKIGWTIRSELKPPWWQPMRVRSPPRARCQIVHKSGRSSPWLGGSVRRKDRERGQIPSTLGNPNINVPTGSRRQIAKQ